MPSLESLNQHYRGKPFVILAIDLQESRETVLRFIRDHGLSYTNLLDSDGKVGNLYGVSSTPVKFLIDTDGNMVGAALGFRDWGKKEVKSIIDILMEKTAS